MSEKLPVTHHKLELPGLKKIIVRNEFGKWQTLPGSMDFHIKMKHTDIEKLADPNYLEMHAKRLFKWMVDHLPSGIYNGVFVYMKEDERIMKISPDSFNSSEHKKTLLKVKEAIAEVI